MIKLSQPNIPEEALGAVVEVIRSGQLVHGEQCVHLERELSRYLGCNECLLVSSGTAALHIALLALNIGKGDAVIVPDFTFPATANVVALVGATPIIVDVDSTSYNIDPDRLAEVVQNWKGPEKLRAIMPVHEFGNPAGMGQILELASRHELHVIEDAACALGAQVSANSVGTLGDLGCFSFHPRKTLTTGEGGAIATNSVELAKRIRLLRNHGMERAGSEIKFHTPGLNYRLTDFQACLARYQLPKLDEWIALRRELAKTYSDKLKPLEQLGLLRLPQIAEGHSWQTYMVVLDKRFSRTEIIDCMRTLGIEVGMGAQSLSCIGLYSNAHNQRLCYPNGKELSLSGLALPFFEKISKKDVDAVCGALSDVLYKLS